MVGVVLNVFCCRDIVDELEEGETDLEVSLKEAYRYFFLQFGPQTKHAPFYFMI